MCTKDSTLKFLDSNNMSVLSSIEIGGGDATEKMPSISLKSASKRC
jgi:hypothetical protein